MSGRSLTKSSGYTKYMEVKGSRFQTEPETYLSFEIKCKRTGREQLVSFPFTGRCLSYSMYRSPGSFRRG